jgi:hypothetical protein
MPLVQCPECRVQQYAHVSYVADVCCVECGYRLMAARLGPSPVLGASAPRGRSRRLGPTRSFGPGLRRPQ